MDQLIKYMTDFLDLVPPQEALRSLISNLPDPIFSDSLIPSVDSIGRVVSSDIISPYCLPNFQRSSVDGYALLSKDTFGASDNMPTYLEIAGEVHMGKDNNLAILSGQTVLIHTGGMVPANADAVIMIEDTQLVGNFELEIRKAIAPGENLIAKGEEIGSSVTVITAGTSIRSVEIGGLMAIGIMEIPVRTKPRIGIISSGDEIILPGSTLSIGKINDVNSYLLASLISKWGGEPVIFGIVQDNLQELISVARNAHENCDMVVFTAGSSVSQRDVTSQAISSLGKPGVLVHGVNLRPGKPTILANCSGKPVIGLPGNPVSAYVTANLFVAPLIKYLLGVKEEYKLPTVRAILSLNIPSQAGREDWVPVKFNTSNNEKMATPVFAKSNFIFSLVGADGLIRIEPDQTGLEAGNVVEIFMFE